MPIFELRIYSFLMQTETLGIISEQLMIFSCLWCSARYDRAPWLPQPGRGMRCAPTLLNSTLNDFVFFFFKGYSDNVVRKEGKGQCLKLLAL